MVMTPEFHRKVAWQLDMPGSITVMLLRSLSRPMEASLQTTGNETPARGPLSTRKVQQGEFGAGMGKLDVRTRVELRDGSCEGRANLGSAPREAGGE